MTHWIDADASPSANTNPTPHYSLRVDFGPGNVLFIRYEDLKGVSKIDKLREIVNFLKLPFSPPEERLQCAFNLSEKTSVHRMIGTLRLH